METTFWKHSEAAYVERKKQMLSEETRRSDWENDLKTKYQLSEGNLPQLGGLDSRDQSRSRSRFLDLLRSTFETFQDYPYCGEKIIFCLGRYF